MAINPSYTLAMSVDRFSVGNKSPTPSKSSAIDIRETLFGGFFSQLAIVPLLVVPLERVKVHIHQSFQLPCIYYLDLYDQRKLETSLISIKIY